MTNELQRCGHCGSDFVTHARNRFQCYVCLPPFGKVDRKEYMAKSVALNAFKRTGVHGACCRPYKTARSSSPMAGPSRPLPLCGVCESNPVRSVQAKTCSQDACVGEWNRRRRRSWRQTPTGVAYRKRHQWSRRRLQKIIDRGDRNCGICGSVVDLSLVHPHPMSASVDHVIPRALGGTNDPTNLQLAHFDCNVIKGDRFFGGWASGTHPCPVVLRTAPKVAGL